MLFFICLLRTIVIGFMAFQRRNTPKKDMNKERERAREILQPEKKVSEKVTASDQPSVYAIGVIIAQNKACVKLVRTEMIFTPFIKQCIIERVAINRN